MKAFAVGLVLAGAALASTPSFWEISTFSDFVKGKLDSVSLSRDGHLSPAPKLDAWFVSEQPVIWAIAQGPDGAIYSATGHNGRVFRTEANGTSKVLWTADRPEVFALAIDPKGILYAASSPDGKIYRLDTNNANGKASEYFDPKTRYIWSLALAADGTLYAGTGDGGRVFRITGAGRGEPWYSTGQGNVTSLMIDPKGRLLAGTEPNGILFNITAKDKAFALYDSSLPEIRAVAPGPEGSIYAVALGGALAKKMQVPPPNTGATPDANITSTTSITVTAAAGGDLKPPPQPVKPPAAPAPETNPQTPAATDTSNAEKSAIYRINADNTVDTLWSSKEENIYDILPLQDGVYFGTDVNGRIYRLTQDRRLTLVAQTNEAEVVRLLQINGNILAVTGNMGKIYKLGPPAARGGYESSVFDAGGVARWGKLRSQSTGTVAIRTRSGNSAHPDATWSDWTPLDQTQIASPNARYLQFTAELSGKAEIENISAAYLPQNTAPTIRSITIISTPAPAIASQPAAKTTTPTFSVTVTDTGDATPVSSTGTPTQTISHAPPEQLTISWQADDPEGDRLVYALDFRGEGEAMWKSIKQDLHDASYSIDADALPDGRYYFRVTASDREVNPVGAKEAELISAPILVDNAPPIVRIQSAVRAANGADISFDAQDAGSALRRAEWSIDAGHWNPVAPVDGVLDSTSEQFRFHIDAVPAGEHLLVIRVADSAGNTGLGKVVLH